MTAYTAGTVTVVNGSATVTGAGTAFVANVAPGYLFWLHSDRKPRVVASVVSNTQITLAEPHDGVGQSGQAYSIIASPAALIPAIQAMNAMRGAFQTYLDGALAGLFEDGTAAEPGIAFSQDPNTGLMRLGENRMGIVTGGQTRGEVDTTSFVFNLPVTGTAVTQADNDTTAGRLLKLGDFGLGAATPRAITDFNQELRPGFYRYSEDSAINAPGTGAVIGCVAMVTRAPGGGVMILASRIAVTAVDQRMWFGIRPGNTGPITWQEMWGIHNVETGSNANSRFTRYPNGVLETVKTLVLTNQNIDTSYGTLYRSGNLISGATTLPAAFVGDPDEISHQVTVQCNDFSVMTAVGGIGDTVNLPATIYAIAPQVLNARTVRVRIQSLGRWK